MLSIVPERGDGVAVEIPHQGVPLSIAALVTELTGVGRPLSVKAGELVHETAVACALLGCVVVVLVAGERLQPIDAEWIR